MAAERLDIILQLITGNYRKEAKDAAVATGQIGDSAKLTSTGVSRMAGGMDQAGKLIKAGFAAVASSAILDVVGSLDQLGQKMEANERMADTVFAGMADDARAWSDANNEAFGVGENAMLGMIATSQDLLVPMGFVREEAFEMSKGILNVSNALSEWKGGTISAADAQGRLTKAMLGETEGLVELGVKISQADIQARLTRKGMDGLTGAALQQAKAQVTLELVTERSTDALKAYEDRAGTAIAAQKDLAAATADSAESWAELLRGPLDLAKGTFSDVADIAAFLSGKMRDLEASADGAAKGGQGLVDVWGAGTPVSAALIDILDWLGVKTREAGTDAATARPKFQGITADFYASRTGAGNLGNELDDLGDSLRALTDPTFAALHALNQAADATRNYITAVQEHGPASEEAERAALDLGEAIGRVDSASAKFAAEGGPASVTAVLEILTNAGVAADTIDRIREAILNLNATPITGRNFPLVTTGPSGAGVHHRQHGGPVRAGHPYIVGEAGPEWMIPDQNGMIVPNSGMVLDGAAGLVMSSFVSAPSYVTKYGPTINVARPMDNFHQDLQHATILASLTNLVEGF